MLLFLCSLLQGCATKQKVHRPREVYLSHSDFDKLQGWKVDNHLAAFTAFRHSCQVIMKKKPDQHLTKHTTLGGFAQHWHSPCSEALSSHIFTNKAARLFFEKWFRPYAVNNADTTDIGKFTGYYEIILHGSKKKTKKYKYPVYGKPDNLDKIKRSSCISRDAIDNGALKGKGLEIAWVDNEAKLFFMQIQGSGMIILDNGSKMRVGYAGQNGYPYVAIGQFIKDYTNETIKSAKDIMNWIAKHPKEGALLMAKNQSYVFFKEIKEHHVFGAQNVPLTPERSIAIDNGLYPYGTPFWIETKLPKTDHLSRHNYHRLMIAQDTGGAIKGAIRADIFFGNGPRQEELACWMNQSGRYFALFPKAARIPDYYISKK